MGGAIGGPGGILEGLARFQQARHGIAPSQFNAQLENAQNAQLLNQAALLQNPGVRNLLTAQPELASQFGLPMTSSVGEAGPQQPAPMLPERYIGPAEIAAQSKQGYFDTLRKLGEQALAEGGEGGGTGGGGGTLSLSGLGPGGPSFSRAPTMDVQEGEINPVTQQGYAPGDIGPTGAKVRRVIPRKGSAKREEKARVYEGFLTRIENFKKEFPPEERAQLAGALNYASNRGGSIASQIGLGGTSPDEQTRFNRFKAGVASIRRFLFEEGGKQLTGNEMRVLNDLLPSGKELGGPNEFEAKLVDLENALGERYAVEAGKPYKKVEGGTSSSSGEEVPDEVKAARDFIRGLGAPVARAEGGPVAPRQLALVGENGPELAQSAGPMMITPLKVGMGPGVSAPDYAPIAPAPKMLQPKGGGVTSGEGLSDADRKAVRGGAKGTVMLGPDGLPVFVRQ